MVEQQTLLNNQHTILLDISLFVLDMLSPEKIKDKYIQQDDGIVLEVPSAFITMIVDAQAGNSLLKKFIDANMVAVKNNPIHKQSQEPKIQELVTATDEKFEQIKEGVYQTILKDFAPLIKDISKTDRISRQSDTAPSLIYPIQVYEPLTPVSRDELQTLQLAYFQELNLLAHPLFDLYFLQIYHAQTASSSELSFRRRELLSVGLATYKTIKTWNLGLFNRAVNDYEDELRGNRGSKEAEIRDDSIELLKLLVSNYFRKEWESIVNDATGIGVVLALTFVRSGNIGLSDVVIEFVTLNSIKLIAKGITKTDSPAWERIVYIIAGLFLFLIVCLFTTPAATRLLIKILSSPTPVVVIPTIIITVPDTPQVPSTLLPVQENEFSSLLIDSTPTLITAIPRITNQPSDVGFCMYVIQSGDSIQSVSSRFQVAEADLRFSNSQVTSDIFQVNRMIEVNAPCCRPIGDNGFSYIVQYGEDLQSISERFSSTVISISSANNLYNSSYIQTGQMLCIPFP